MRTSIEIEPASHEQVAKAGEDWIIIEQDLGGVAQELKEIDKRLHVRYNLGQEFYAIYAKERNEEYLVNTTKKLDKRIVNRIREIMDSRYDFAAEGEKLDKEKKAAFDYKMDQIHGENAEKMAFAIRKDLELDKNRAFIGNSRTN